MGVSLPLISSPPPWFSKNSRGTDDGEERVRIVEREGRGRRRALWPSLVSRSRPEIPSAPGGEKPRARLMALRGCHGYREPHGSDATAAPRPAESPFILEKHYKNARAARAASRSLLAGALASLSLHALARSRCTTYFVLRVFRKARKSNPRRGGPDCRWCRESGEKSGTWSQKSRVPALCWALSRDFRRGDRFGLLSRVRREADVRFLRALAPTRHVSPVLSREIFKTKKKKKKSNRGKPITFFY